MPLDIQTRAVGDVSVVGCTGRIIEGDEVTALEGHVRELLDLRRRHLLLDMREVSFVDSAGLGLLVRLLARARAAGGNLMLCGTSPHIQKTLRVTRLHQVLASFEGEADAIAALYRPEAGSAAAAPAAVDIVCVHPSHDVLAYAQQLLRQAGYGVVTTTNRADAATLLRATRPTMLLVDAVSSAAWDGGVDRLVGGSPSGIQVVALPATFATDDPGAAGERLLADVARAAAARL